MSGFYAFPIKRKGEKMNEEKIKEIEQTEQIPQEQKINFIKDATLEQLKVAAFDTDMQIQKLKAQYQILLQEIQRRINSD
jgi:hypothetical protein